MNSIYRSKFYLIAVILLVVIDTIDTNILAATTTILRDSQQHDAYTDDALLAGYAYPVDATYRLSFTNNLCAGSIRVNYVGGNLNNFDLVYQRSAVKFDISSISGTITNASLKIYVVDANGSPVVNLISTTDNTWTQTNQRFPSYTPSNIINGYSGSPVSGNSWKIFDVKNYLQNIIDGGSSEISFVVTGNEGGNQYFNFVSNLEDTQTELRPVLEITYTPVANPPIVTGTTPANNPSWNWSSGGGGNGTFRYKLNNSDFTIGTTTTTSTSYSPGPLSEGIHTLYVQESNGASPVRWSATGSFPITVDLTRPSVTISSTSPNPTNTSPIPLTITFDQAVTGFTSSDLIINNGSVSSFSGSGTSYSVGVTPSAQGNVTINITENIATDAAGNGNYAATQLMRTFDSELPDVLSINRQDPAGTPTNSTSVVFRATFSENVYGIDINDFSLNTSGTVTGTKSSVSAGSGTIIDITINSISGVGTFRLDLKNSGTGIADNAGNAISGGFTGGESYSFPIPTITFAGSGGFTQSFTPGSSCQAIGRFRLIADVNGASLTGNSIMLDGTREGLSNLKFWSSPDDLLGEDTQLGSTVAVDPGSGNSVSFNGFSSSISTSGTYYFLTADLSSEASGTVQGIIVENSSLTLSGGTLSGTISEVVLSGGTAPLPVELTSFTTAVVNNRIELKWQTETEVNNYGFQVERLSVIGNAIGTGQSSVISNNPKSEIYNPQWEVAGFVEGSGNSNSPKQYSFTDDNPPPGNLQYRLKQIDTDGQYQYYSTIAEVNFNLTDVEDKQLPKEFTLSQNYPNPFNPSTGISYQLPVLSHATLKVYDILGNEVATLVNEVKTPGYYQVKFDGINLSSGIYIYRLTAGSFTSSKKLMLMK